ncbi:MAG: ABC transporter ATP-binding protein [Thermomicrobiales bacterium]
MTDAIVVDGLSKSYGATIALEDVRFAVRQGEIFGIVGPNGAGKTTLVECISGLREPDSGTVRILNLDPWRSEREVRERIGIQLQQAALPNRIRVQEALDLFASFYAAPAATEPLLEQWGLTQKRQTAFTDLSGGQKQRLFIALALVNNPELVVLDELTTGLDPRARRMSWALVRAIRDQAKTVILVTHFMDEAEQLCDRVAIVAGGRLVALDSPAGLRAHAQPGQAIRFTTANGFDPARLRRLPGVTDVVHDGDAVTVRGAGPLMAHVATTLADEGIIPTDLRTEQATLEDVFLTLSGMRDEASGAGHNIIPHNP